MIKIKKLDYKLLISLILLLVCTYITKKTMFIEGDGFNSQILHVVKGADDPLSKIHQIRFLVVAPFYIFGKDSTIIQAICIYIYVRPILKEQNFKVCVMIVAIIIMFSYRTSIVAMSLPYFHLYQKNNKKRYLVISFLFSILSSATVLNFMAIYLLYNYKKVYKKLVYILILFIAFLPSLKNKIFYFTEGGTGYFETMVYRSFLAEALRVGIYTRIAIIIFVVFIFFLQVLTILKNGKIKVKDIEKIFPILFLFMEGLGIYFYLIEDVIIFDKLFKIKKKKVVKE